MVASARYTTGVPIQGVMTVRSTGSVGCDERLGAESADRALNRDVDARTLEPAHG